MNTSDQPASPSKFYIQAVFSVLFFMWGLLTVLNFVLIDHLTKLFNLSYSLSTLINVTFFSAYLVVSLNASRLIKKIGYKKGILVGWGLALAGCFLFFIAIISKNYQLFLAALFLQAAGITILQVGANLYVVLYQDDEKSASRLNLVQGFNSLGTFVAGFVHFIILSPSAVSDNDYLSYLTLPYLTLGILMVLFGIVLYNSNIPDIKIANKEPLNEMPPHPRRHVLHFPQLRLGAFAIFAYVGAEVALNNYLEDFAEMNVQYYWGAAMVGRFIGAWILLKVSPRVAVGASAGAATLLILTSIFESGNGSISIWTITAVGLFNSILFPTIFALGVNGLGKFALHGSGVLIMSIVGGAVIPFMVRNFSLMKGYPQELCLQLALAIPVICYIYIGLYGLKLSKFKKRSLK